MATSKFSSQADSDQEPGDETLVVPDVSVSPLNASDQQALFDTESDLGIYTDYAVVNRYEFDHGIYMMGVTSPGGFQGNSAAFVQLKAETLLWIADWTARKNGEMPGIPSFQQTDPNVVLLDTHFEPSMTEVMADGVTVVYRISGSYVYGFKNPNIANMFHGRPPWLVNSVDMTVKSENFEPGIICEEDLSQGGIQGNAETGQD